MIIPRKGQETEREELKYADNKKSPLEGGERGGKE